MQFKRKDEIVNAKRLAEAVEVGLGLSDFINCILSLFSFIGLTKVVCLIVQGHGYHYRAVRRMDASS